MPLLLVLLFIVVPIAELALLIQVGQLIGVWWTVALLIADAMLGSLLLRSQGRAAWRRFNEALAEGRVPHREVVDGVLVIFGGVLLLTPGFITDIFGLLFLFPPTRVLMRRLLVRRGALKLVASMPGTARPAAQRPRRTTSRAGPWTSILRLAERRPMTPREARRCAGPGTRTRSRSRGRTPTRACTGSRGWLRAWAPTAPPLRARWPIAFAGRDTLGAIAEPGPSRRRSWSAETSSAAGALGGARCGELELRADLRGADAAGLLRGQQGAREGGRDGGLRAALPRRRHGARRARALRGLGQRGHTWGNPDWDKIALTRAVGAWFDDGSGLRARRVVRGTRRPTTPTRRHGARRTAGGGREIDEIRGSRRRPTGPHRQIRAGLELWLSKDDDYPYRGKGEVLTGSTLELGALRLDVAFFRWHIEGRTASAATT